MGTRTLSESGARLPGLDHLRALAIAMVFVFHYRLIPHPDWYGDLGDFGWTGVDLFFVLSGYLIASQLLAGETLKRFFVKRVFRILPAFWVVLAVYALVPWFREKEALPPLWRFLTFTQNFGLDFTRRGTFSHAWSLCVEEQFYLVLPFILWVGRGRWKRLLFLPPVLFVAGFVFRYVAWVQLVHDGRDYIAWYKHIYYPTYQRLDGLVMGASLAALMLFAPRARALVAKHGNVLLIASLAVLLGAYQLTLHQRLLFNSVVEFPVIAFGYCLLVASALSDSSVLRHVPAWSTRWLAMLSFPIYLVHKGTNHFVQTMLPDEESTLAFVLSILFAVLVAALVHILVERPMLARSKLLY